MKTFVCIKQVPDTETKIRIKGDKSGIETDGIKWIISPYDEFAIEEALKTKEKIKEGTVTALTLGPDRCVDALRTALAMGCDNAIHIKTDDVLDSLSTSEALAGALKQESPNLIFAGKQAIDNDQGAVFGYVSEFLDMPSASVVVKFELSDDKSSAKVERELEGGSQGVIEMPLPAMIAVDKGINSPRYASLPGIMKAKKKEIKGLSLSDLGVSADASGTTESDFELPPERAAGKIIDGEPAEAVKELVRLLREEAKVI